MAIAPAKYENLPPRAACRPVGKRPWALTLGGSRLSCSPLSHPMANTRSAAKSARQTIRRSLDNKRILTGIKTQTKKVRSALAS